MTKLTKQQEEKLKENWSKTFQPPEMIYLQNPDNKLSCPICGVKAEEISDWWINQINSILNQEVCNACMCENAGGSSTKPHTCGKLNTEQEEECRCFGCRSAGKCSTPQPKQEEVKSFHSPCPYGNDNCKSCNPQPKEGETFKLEKTEKGARVTCPECGYNVDCEGIYTPPQQPKEIELIKDEIAIYGEDDTTVDFTSRKKINELIEAVNKLNNK